jgi:transposase-like protein
VPFLSFDVEIPEIICSTNLNESVNPHTQGRRARGHVPNEAATLKCVCMAPMSPDPTGKGCKR